MAGLISPADSRTLSTGYYGSFKLAGLHFFFFLFSICLSFSFFFSEHALSEKARSADGKQGQAKKKNEKKKEKKKKIINCSADSAPALK